MTTEKGQRVLGRDQTQPRHECVGGLPHEIWYRHCLSVGGPVGRNRAGLATFGNGHCGDGSPVLNETAGVRRPFGQNPAQGSEVIGQQRPGHGLQGGAREIGLSKDAVLLLEIQHGRTHGRVVSARLVLGRVHQPLASQALFHLGKGGPLGLNPQVGLHIARAARVSRRQFLQARHARLGARGLQAQADQPVFGRFFFLRGVAKGLDAVHREQTGVVHAGLAGPGRVREKTCPQHRKRRRNAIEFEVVPFTRGQGLAIPVAAIVGQSDEHRPVAIGQKAAVGCLAVLEDDGRPSVGEIHQGQAALDR